MQDDSDGCCRSVLMPCPNFLRDSEPIHSPRSKDMQHKTLLAAAFTAGLMGFGAAHAQYTTTTTTTIVRVAPPAARSEVVPQARPGHVWAPGHYEWRGREYTWVEGQWMTARNGYEYREPRWVQRGNGEWVMVGGNWERGRSGDRYSDNGPRGDRDGDGVQNRHDRFPNNPRRS
jgi:hypothetical protein